MKVLILAGGSGTRLFPLSHKDLPKPLLAVTGDKSLLSLTLRRFLRLVMEDEIFIITNEDQRRSLVMKLKSDGLRRVRVLCEPVSRNTLPAVCYALFQMQTRYGVRDDEIIVISPADHVVHPEGPFISQVRRALPAAADNRIVTFGVKPTRPETGYGYIRCGKPRDGFWPVKKFIEKPEYRKARLYSRRSDYLWNTGVFAMSVSKFWQETRTQRPHLAALFQNAKTAPTKARLASLKPISLDHGIMEKAAGVACLPLKVRWSDIGSWDALYNFYEKDDRYNARRGRCIDLDCEGSLLYATHRALTAVGIKDLIIVETEEAVLVAPRGQSQRIKELSALWKNVSDKPAAKSGRPIKK